MAGELGNETNIDLLGSSTITMSTPNFALIGNDDFVTNLVLKKLVLFVFAEISSRSSRIIEHATIFHILFFFRLFSFAHAVMCQGRCLQISSPNSQCFARYNTTFRLLIRFYAGPSRIYVPSNCYSKLCVL